jgi:hypothetical protein
LTRIAITAEGFEAIAVTLSLGRHPFGPLAHAEDPPMGA